MLGTAGLEHNSTIMCSFVIGLLLLLSGKQDTMI